MAYNHENKKADRIQKILARAGVASRRKCEDLITEGSVTVNGKVAKLGDKAIMGVDAIKVSGKLLKAADAAVYYAFYKPRQVISMLVDNENRPNLSDYLTKVYTRVFPIGRLDFNSEGLILLTNDGDFAEAIQKHETLPRVYTVKVKGIAGEEAIKALTKGARLDFQMVRPHSVRKLRELENKTQLQIVFKGGGAIDLRALFELKGLLVDKVTRTQIGHLSTKGMVPGMLKPLLKEQAMRLLDEPNLGIEILEREAEASKPKGQRNVHESKDLSGDWDDAKPAAGAKPAIVRPARKAVIEGKAFTAPDRTARAFAKPAPRPASEGGKRGAGFDKRAGKGFGSGKPDGAGFGKGAGKGFGSGKPDGAGFGKGAGFGGKSAVRRRGEAPKHPRGGASSSAAARGGDGYGVVKPKRGQ